MSSQYEFGESSNSKDDNFAERTINFGDVNEVEDLNVVDEEISDEDVLSDDEDEVIEELDTEPDIDSDDEDEGYDINTLDLVEEIKFGDVSMLEGAPCACIEPPDLTSALGLIVESTDITPGFDNSNCIIDNIIRCYNKIFKGNRQQTEIVDKFKLAFADLFYRFRHEVLFKALCLSLNLPITHSDMPFSNYGVESNRTPDLIIELENGFLIIIEVTVTSSLEKAAMNKGMDQMGFESKYQKEIDQLCDKGVPNAYIPVFFDMSNTTHPLFLEQYNILLRYFKKNEPYKLMLDVLSREIAILTNNIKSDLILPSSILFSGDNDIPIQHDELSFLYQRNSQPIKLNVYDEIVVSPQVYQKVLNDKNRLFWLLDHNSFKDCDNLVFVLNTVSHRVALERNSCGATLNQLRDILIKNDIISMLKLVKIKIGNLLQDSTTSEVGVKFYEKINPQSRATKSREELPPIVNHSPLVKRFKFDSTQYTEKLNCYKSRNYHSNHFDPDYEDILIKSITDFDKNGDYSDLGVENLLGNLESRGTDIDKVMDDIKQKYLESNNQTEVVPIIKLKMKQPFLMPIVDLNSTSYCPLEFKNINLIDRIAGLISDESPYTSLILKNVLNDNYKLYSAPKLMSKELNQLIGERSKLSNEINLLQKSLYKKGSSDGNIQLSKTNDPEYSTKFKEIKMNFRSLNKEIESRKKRENIGKHISYVRLPTKGKNSNLRVMYELEMKHFKNRKVQSTIEGVGIINNIDSDYNDDFEIFNNICEMLVENRGINPNSILHDFVSEDANLLKDLKKAALDNYRNLLNEIQNSCLGHSAGFISRLGHTLMYFSQLPFSSDYVRVDNLGYKDCLLLIKGGKKIFKSKSSKMFRLIFPISDFVLPWYINGHDNKGSFRVYRIGDINYAVTPWSMLHESILTDSISFYPRVASFTLLNLNHRLKLKDQFSSVSLNVLLAFHNRRHTEVILANLRYILLSTLGDFTGVQLILPEFFGFNYDRFQSFIRNSIFKNYPNYFKQLQSLKSLKTDKNKDINISDFKDCRLKNIFTLDTVRNTEELALMIYSTFLMTKAPYQKVAERARNLRGILDIHDQYDREVGLSSGPEMQLENISVCNNGDFSDYAKRLFTSDFNFDPKFCANVGCFINSVFKNQNESEEIQAAWIKIMNQSWDEMATSTGLRGDYSDVENFWGQKGYFVVYKKVLNRPGFRDGFLKLFTEDKSSDEKRKILRGLNEVYLDNLETCGEFLIFHAVDKVQWRGGREIYVMDVNTKLLQQPIEKFMGYLCQKLDNELISIPSDRRAQVIHHSIFEKDLPLSEMLTWYLTLDCSKWAPKSIFVKFVITILNMDCIPTTFKTHFMNYINKLYYKRIYFNKAEVETLVNNTNYKDICNKHLIRDEKVGGYYLLMPYSWVMGIFNYTSSFLHAANQKYTSYLLMKTTLLSFNEEASLTMFAHSDDSGGKLCVSNKFQAKRALIIYEVLLKSCNHLLSKKKSVVSRIYFEILSVIYLFKQLLALLPKFLGGIRFLPTDKGPAQDMLQCYSKSIEVMVAGADFSIAYIVMKIYSYLIWKFYYNRDPSELDYQRPVQYLGMPDSHPLFTLLCGSDADILRLIRNKIDLTKLISFVNIFSKSIDEEGPIKPLLFEIKVKGIKRGFEEDIDTFKELLSKWSIRNVNYHNTGMNCMSFLRKLNDSGFVGSLVNESTVRRISRAYFIRTGSSSITRFGNVRLNDTLDAINLCQSYSKSEGVTKHILSGILSEKDINDIDSNIELYSNSSNKIIQLLHETLRSPLNIYKYLEVLSLEGRKIDNITRTLKPTQIQLVRSTKVFSSDFDPASLVSYVKEPELRWALQNLKGLFTSAVELEHFMMKNGFDINDTSPDMLLRVCRTYGRDSVKNIYVYSRIPSDIRQIRSYTAFLSFLSINSFNGREISGLTMKIDSKEMGKEYLQTQLTEEVYLVNNLVNLILTLVKKCGIEFVKGLTIKDIPEISFKSSNLINFINHLRGTRMTDVRYCLISIQLNILEFELGITSVRSDVLKGSYYCFLKSQKSRGGWYGKGEMYIKIDDNYYSIVINNSEIEMIYTNKIGKLQQHHFEYIVDVCNQNGIQPDKFKRIKPLNYNKMHYGFDNSGEASILKGREIEKGIPCVLLEKRNEFVDQLDFYRYSSFSNNQVFIETGFEDNTVTRKLHLLPIKTVTLLTTIKLYLDPKDFEDKMVEIGLNDFEEFIYTEILTEYGKDLHIGFVEFLDNYMGSKTYEVFKKVFDNSLSKVLRSPEFSPLPASEGSLIRILIDYSRATGDNVIKVPTTLNPEIMQIRSEHPERMTTLLGDKLLEYFNQIYNNVEKKEIEDSYSAIESSDDIKKVREQIVKLMTYWGYGSLVNSLENFSLVKNPGNYFYFNKKNMLKSNAPLFAELFVTLSIIIQNTAKKWSPIFNSLDTPVESIFKITDRSTWVTDHLYSIIMCIYGHVNFKLRNSLSGLIFANTLLGYLKDDSFISDLQNELSKNYILSTLPISWANRFDFLATFNSLASVWAHVNKAEFTLDYSVKLQRLPDGVPNYRSFLKDFNLDFSSASTYYHGFINSTFLSYLYTLQKVEADGREYNLSLKINKKSETEICMTNSTKFLRPLKDEIVEEELYEDLLSETQMADLDYDTIEELFGELKELDIYKPKTTKIMKIKSRTVVRATIHIIIEPYKHSTYRITNCLRNIGENIILITDDLYPDFLTAYPNSGVKLLTLSKKLKNRVRPLLAYYSFVNELSNKSFINKFLPFNDFEIGEVQMEMLKENIVRNQDSKICKPSELGMFFTGEIGTGEKVIEDRDGFIELVDRKNSSPSGLDETVPENTSSEEYELEIKNKKELMKIEKVEEKLKVLSDNNIIDKKHLKNLRDKYRDKLVKDGLPLDLILRSLVRESELICVNSMVLDNTAGISAENQKRMFLHPVYFGLAKGLNRNDINPVKDKKLRSELNSFHEDLASLIGSNTLKISFRTKKLLLANFKMWVKIVKIGKFKSDNKNFLLTLLISLASNSFTSEDEGDDMVWQSIINKTTEYISDDGPDSDEDDELIDLIFDSIPMSRLKYRPLGT